MCIDNDGLRDEEEAIYNMSEENQTLAPQYTVLLASEKRNEGKLLILRDES